jgi:hypothetical protein
VAEVLALVRSSAGVAPILTVVTMATGVSSETPPRAMPDPFARSLVPTHRRLHPRPPPDRLRSSTASECSLTFSAPFSRGNGYLGTADLQINYWLSGHPSFLGS